MKSKIIRVNTSDNVAVALVNLKAGEVISFEGKEITVLSDIKSKHKIALQKFESGDRIVMYSVLVGSANGVIEKGGALTTENVKHQSEKVFGKTETIGWTAPNVEKWKDKTFLGYHREDGQVGTENVWLFFPLVFCENRNIEILKEVFEKELLKQKVNPHQMLLRSLVNNNTEAIAVDPNSSDVFNNIDVKFITHPGGCGGIRQDSESLAKLLAGYVNNPNVAGATVLSLGCQNLQISVFKEALKSINPNLNKPVLIFEQQQMGTVDEMLSAIVKESFEANELPRGRAHEVSS